MALAKDLVSAGFSQTQASALTGSVKTSLSAAGTTISDATALTASVNGVSTVTGADGVILYNGQIGDSQIVFNNQSTYHLLVYPPTSSMQINQITAGGAHRLPPYTVCTYWKVNSTQIIAVMSR